MPRGDFSIHSVPPQPPANHQPMAPPSPFLLYGWRKHCLFVGLLLLSTLLIINITLIVWIFQALGFTLDGMKIRTCSDARQEYYARVLKTSSIKSETTPLEIKSAKNITMQVKSWDGSTHAKLSLGTKRASNFSLLTRWKPKGPTGIETGDQGIRAHAESISVRTLDGRTLFHTDKHETSFSARKLIVNGARGLSFNGSIHTSKVRSDAINDLWLEAPATRVHIQAQKGVNLFSPAGSILVESQTDIKLQSVKRSIRLDSDNIQLKNIPVSEAYGTGRLYADVYQLCVCAINGRVFMAEVGQSCIATEDICS